MNNNLRKSVNRIADHPPWPFGSTVTCRGLRLAWERVLISVSRSGNVLRPTNQRAAGSTDAATDQYPGVREEGGGFRGVALPKEHSPLASILPARCRPRLAGRGIVDREGLYERDDILAPWRSWSRSIWRTPRTASGFSRRCSKRSPEATAARPRSSGSPRAMSAQRDPRHVLRGSRRRREQRWISASRCWCVTRVAGRWRRTRVRS